MAPRGGRRPGDRQQRGRRHVQKTPPGKKGWCELAIPLAVARTAVALAQQVAVDWRIRAMGGAR